MILICSFSACKKEERNPEIKKDKQGFTELHISEKQLIDRLEKVTLTTENWRDYFEDYEYTEHKMETDEHGAVVNEYDVTYRGFGLKRDIKAVYNTISFKFLGMTEVYSDNSGSCVYKAGESKATLYDADGTRNKQIECKKQDYYLAQIVNNGKKANEDDLSGVQLFADYECIEVVGELIVYDLPITSPYEQITFVFDNDETFTDGYLSYDTLIKYVK